MAGGLLELGDSFGDLVDPVAELPDRLGDLQQVVVPVLERDGASASRVAGSAGGLEVVACEEEVGALATRDDVVDGGCPAGAVWPSDLADEPVSLEDGSTVFCQALVL